MNVRRMLFVAYLCVLACLVVACTVKPVTRPATDAQATAGTESVVGIYAPTNPDQTDRLWLRDDGTFSHITGSGTYTLTPDQITFVADFAEDAPDCSPDPGVYSWSLEATGLALAPISDTCQSRINAFGSSTFAKAQDDAGIPVEFVWRIRAATPDGLHKPMSIALDPQSNLYVLDAVNSRIRKYDPSGRLLTMWGGHGDGDGEFVFEAEGGIWGDLTVDGQGNVYVYDAHHRIQKFDANGRFLTQWGSQGTGPGQFGDFAYLGADAGGNVYASDANNKRIQKFDGSGNLLTMWGHTGEADGEFEFPFGIAVNQEGNVFVVDPGNFRVQKFDGDGNFLAKWGSEGTGADQFTFPLGVAVDTQDNVYVTDNGANRIIKFSGDGALLSQWGAGGTDLGTFNYPRGIAVDKQGNVYVANVDDDVQKFRTK